MLEQIKINLVKPNPDNPRVIRDIKFKRLVESIKEFPEMLKLRPIVVNKEMIALGGNMRLKACQKAGLEEIWIVRMDNLSPEQQIEFMVKDNINYGEWNWNLLNLDQWEQKELDQWSIELPEWINENNIDDLNLDELAYLTLPDKDKLQLLKLKFSTEDYNKIISGLEELNSNLSLALLTFLNITPHDTTG
jgi:hypothetical protein